MENYVCTFEQAERLRDFGIRQDSLWSWCGDKGHMPPGQTVPWLFISTTVPANSMEEEHRELVPSKNPLAAAFDVTELGIMLGYGTTFIGLPGEEAKSRADKLLKHLEAGTQTAGTINQKLNSII